MPGDIKVFFGYVLAALLTLGWLALAAPSEASIKACMDSTNYSKERCQYELVR